MGDGEREGGEREGGARRFNARLLAIVAGAAVLRVAYVLVVMHHRLLGSDANFYSAAGFDLAEGDGYLSFSLVESATTAQFPPGLPLLLAATSSVFGRSRLAQELTLALLGAATVALVGLLGRRVAGVTVGLVAAAMAMVHPMLLAADGSLMSESLYVLLVVAVLLLALRSLDEPSARRWLALGLGIGIATLTRGDGILLVPFVAGPALVMAGAKPTRRLLVSAGAVLLGVALFLVPWTIRNAVEMGEPIVLSNNSGSVLAGANCKSTYAGPLLGSWDPLCLFRVDTGPDDSDSEVVNARRWTDAGLDHARDHVRRLVVTVVPVRVARTWGLWRPFDQMRAEVLETRAFGTGVAGWATTLALLALAIPAAWRHRSYPAVRLFLGVIAMVCVSSALTYGNQRFRVAAEPVIVVLAAMTVAAYVQRRATRRQGPGLIGPT